MDPWHGEPPAVARQRVRRALRTYRNQIALSQGEVAQRLGWSLSKVQRIEAGEVGISVTDLRAALAMYGVRDPAEIERLSEDARTSRRQRWWMAQEYREHLTPASRNFLQFESEATSIRAYQPTLIPGVLQTPAVAEIVLGWKNHKWSDGTRRVRFDVRMRRRAQLIERQDGPEYLLILNEAVIRRRVGNAKLMAEQLESLAEAADLPRIRIRVVPLTKGAVIGIIEPFQILTLGAGESKDNVLYIESLSSDRISHNHAEIAGAQETFDVLWEQALNEDASLRVIRAEALMLRTSLDLAD